MSTIPLLPDHLVDADDLVLRCWRVEDAPALATAIAESHEHLRPWMAWIAEEPMALADREALIADWERQRLAGRDAVYGIWLDGRVAGGAGLHRRGTPATLEIGYWLHAAAVGRGLATRVAGVLTAAALTVPGIDAVEIHHDVSNERSAAVPRRLGYRPIPDPDGRGHAAWRVERAEWAARPA